MKIMKNLLFCLLAVAALVLSSCSDDDDNTTYYDGTTLTGDITSDVSLNASVEYTLTGTVSVKSGATLTIPAGTVIKAKAGSTGFSQYIIVEQGGKIMAKGTASKPIVFTSGASSPAAGDWGGLIINGYAPISGTTSGTTSDTEIDENIPYGGSDSEDNSGVLEYVVLAYTGARSSADIEHNGLTLDAVGSGTTIENIYVPYSADDGVECFGGSVDITNIMVLDEDDDMFDNTQGYTGTITNAYGVWSSGYTSSESDPRGVESDGNLDGKTPAAVDQTNFAIKNMTIINNATTLSASGWSMNDIIKIRRGATATITNALAKNGTAGSAVNLYDKAGSANAATSISLTVSGVTFVSGELVNTDNVAATVNFPTTNTGVDTSIFSWVDDVEF